MTPFAPPPDGADDLDPTAPPLDDLLAVDPASQLLHIETNADGDVELTFGSPEAPADPEPGDFGANLTERLDDFALGIIAQDLLEAIEQDEDSRREWVEAYAAGIKLLGLTLDKPSDDMVEGMSTIRHPLLLEAVLRFQANARSELLPTDGPVKIRDDNEPVPSVAPPPMPGMPPVPPPPTTSDLADALESEANHYLTTVATEFYPDTDKMLFALGLGGSAFKKVYYCPMRRRPVSESVPVQDLIVSNDATSLETAGRVTHRIRMRPSVLKRMQLLGAYRTVELAPAMDREHDAVDEQISTIEGRTDPGYTRDDDREREILECYAELDLSGYGLTEPDAPDGLPLPYKVTIDKDSRDILEIRRHWQEDDAEFTARQQFVEFVFVPGLKFLGIGLLHILGNTAAALTAAWRIALDGGMLSNFPGGLIAEGATRQDSLRLAAGVGQFHKVNTGGMPINQAVMPFPFKPTDPAFIEFAGSIASTGQRIGGTAEINVGEGRQDAPVGTTVAMIEQATKVLDAVHKRMHQAQQREFTLLFDLFREYPEALFAGSKRPAIEWDETLVLRALQDHDLVPVADPNTSSHLQRMMKAQAVYQMVSAAPQLVKSPIKAFERILRDMRVDSGYLDLVNTEEGYAAAMQAMAQQHGKGGPPQQDTPADTMMAQARMLDAQTKAQALQIDQQAGARDSVVKAAEIQQKTNDNTRSLADQAADREANLQMAKLKFASDLVIHHSGQRHAADQAHADRLHAAAQAHADRGIDFAKAGLAGLVAHHGNEARAGLAAVAAKGRAKAGAGA